MRFEYVEGRVTLLFVICLLILYIKVDHYSWDFLFHPLTSPPPVSVRTSISPDLSGETPPLETPDLLHFLESCTTRFPSRKVDLLSFVSQRFRLTGTVLTRSSSSGHTSPRPLLCSPSQSRTPGRTAPLLKPKIRHFLSITS